MAKLNWNRHTLKLLEQFADLKVTEVIGCLGLSILDNGLISATDRCIVLMTKPSDLRAIEKEFKARRIASLVKIGCSEDIEIKDIELKPNRCYAFSDGSELGEALDPRVVLCPHEEHKTLACSQIIATVIRILDEVADKAKAIKNEHMVDSVVRIVDNDKVDHFIYPYMTLAYRTLHKLGYKMCQAVRYKSYLYLTAGSTTIVVSGREVEGDNLLVQTITVPKYVAPLADKKATEKQSKKQPDAKPKAKNAKSVKKP